MMRLKRQAKDIGWATMSKESKDAMQRQGKDMLDRSSEGQKQLQWDHYCESRSQFELEEELESHLEAILSRSMAQASADVRADQLIIYRKCLAGTGPQSRSDCMLRVKRQARDIEWSRFTPEQKSRFQAEALSGRGICSSLTSESGTSAIDPQVVQNLLAIVPNFTEAQVQSALLQCGHDENRALDALLSSSY